MMNNIYNKKAIRLINVMARLDDDKNADLIDEIICNSIQNGIEITNLDEEIVDVY